MKALITVYRRIRTLFRLAELLRVDDTSAVQTVQIKTGADEVLSDVQHRQPYGYAYNPKKDGADPLVIALGGNPGHSLVIMVGNRKYRLKGLAEGEVALYDDLEQQFILKRTHIEVNAPLGYLFNGDGTFNGNNLFLGDNDFNGSVNANGKTIDDTHGHNGDSGGVINGVT